MAKTSSVFVCSSCGYESPKWLGKCPACNEWNTFYEEKLAKTSSGNKIKNLDKKPTKLNNVEKSNTTRMLTGFEELDRVLRRWISKRFFSAIRRRTRYRKIHSNTTNL